jgi:hypothetical protein
MEEKKEQY